MRTMGGRAIRRSTRERVAMVVGRKRFTTTCSIAGCEFRRSPEAVRVPMTTRWVRIVCTYIAAKSFLTKPGGRDCERGGCSSRTVRCYGPRWRGNRRGIYSAQRGGRPLTLEIGLNLATRVPVEYLQIIKNGEVEAEVRLADWKDQKGKLPPLTFDASGWFLVRAVTNNPQTYQFASSGPYYVEAADRPRVSKKSVQFFLDWIDAAEARLRKLPNLSEAQLNQQLAAQEEARKFFSDLLASANAE